MLLNEIIRRIRGTETMFGDRVAGAYGTAQIIENQDLEPPSAFVIPISETASKPSGLETEITEEEITRTFQILVVLEACDPRSQEPVDFQERARDDLFKALLNWRPTEAFGPSYYLSMITGGTDASRSLFGFNFNFTEFLNYECYRESEEQAFDQLTGVKRINLTVQEKGCEDNCQSNKPIYKTTINKDRCLETSDCPSGR